MKLDLTIGIGDLITFLLFIAAGIALMLQRRSVKLTEKQLESDIEDVRTLANETKELAAKIEKEGQLREAVAIQGMDYYAKSTDYGSHIFNHYLKTSRDEQLVLIEHFATLILSMRAMIKVAATSLKKPDKLVLIKNVLDAMTNHLVLEEQWTKELSDVSLESEKRSKEIKESSLQINEMKKKYDEENARLEEKIDGITERYSALVAVSGSIYRAAREEVSKYCEG